MSTFNDCVPTAAENRPICMRLFTKYVDNTILKILKSTFLHFREAATYLLTLSSRRSCAFRAVIRANRSPFLPSLDDPVTPSDPNAILSIPYQCSRRSRFTTPLRNGYLVRNLNDRPIC